MLADLFLREVPGHLLAARASGEVKVYGSIIRSVATGRIVGHLQETSALSDLVGRTLSAPALPLQGAGLAVDLVGHGVSYVQNEQIKAALNVVQNLQVANLAVAAAGVGVSVAGFAVIAAKIRRMEAKVDAVGEKLDAIARGIELLRRDRIADDFARLRTLAEQMEEGWALADPVPQWRQVAGEAHMLGNLFKDRAAEAMRGPTDFVPAEPLLEAYALANAIRVAARLVAGDDAAALLAAEEGARSLADLGERVSVADAAIVRTAEEKVKGGTAEWDDALKRNAAEFQPVVSALRAREAASVGAALTVVELGRQGISGRDWLEAARAEESSPLLCLIPAADAAS